MTHHILDHSYHYTFDCQHEPSLVIDPGDAITFECREAADGQITPESTTDDLVNGDVDRIHSMLGPVRIAGAEVGDVVEVNLLSLEHHGWGWTALTPQDDGVLGEALLAEDISDELLLRIVNVNQEDCLEVLPNVRIPVNPSCGLVGLAPAEPGPHRTLWPRRTGGNMDNRYLRAGSTAYLPVEVDGGLLSLGDCHLAQGDGQSSLYALEAPMTVTARVNLHKNWQIASPRYDTAPGCRHRHDGMGFHATSSFGPDLYTNAQEAAREMVAWLQARYDLTRTDAYLLLGLAGNLVINEIVDKPQYHVSLQVPRDIFVRA